MALEAYPETFIRIASEKYGMGNHIGLFRIAGTFNRRFRSNYGTSPLICAILWNMINPTENPRVVKGVQH